MVRRYFVWNLGEDEDNPCWIVRDSMAPKGGLDIVYWQPKNATWTEQAWVVSRRMNGGGGRGLERELRQLELEGEP